MSSITLIVKGLMLDAPQDKKDSFNKMYNDIAEALKVDPEIAPMVLARLTDEMNDELEKEGI